MSQEATKSLPLGLVALIALNLIPVIGVLHWGWHSFDLIFLYWMENLVIGAFTVARMVIRPYSHLMELFFPLFLAPFFAVHYGGFCWGHGTFIVSLFGPEDGNGFELLPTVIEVLSSPTMLFALAALTSIQAMDWLRDARLRGFGADSVKRLMFQPYRRIVVLHVTILAGGFALAALDEPMMGLVILVGVKTASDVWHWRKGDEVGQQAVPFEITPELLAEMQEKYPRPVVTVNGQEREFESFAELMRSKEFRMAKAVMRLLGAGKEIKAFTAYMEMRAAAEQGGEADWLESGESRTA